MSNHNLKVPDWITKDYLVDVLKKSFPEDSIVLNDYQITPGSSVGDNYVCQILRIKFDLTRNGKQENISMISKVVPVTETSKAILKDLPVYAVERTMLNETLPILIEKLKNQGPTFCPKLYYCDLEHEIFHMEDLSVKGYKLVDKRKGLDLEHSLLVIRSLAAIHAASYLALLEKPEIKNSYLDYYWKEVPGSTAERIIFGGQNYFLEGIEHWPISEERKNKFRKLKDKFFKMACDSYANKNESFNVILHGDCWINNMMFKYNENGVEDVKLIDYQVANYNSIGLDLNYFIFTSTQIDVRLNHVDKLLETYYDAFIQITGEIEGFGLEIVRKEYQERLLFGFTCQFFFRPGLLNDFDFDSHLQQKHSEVNRLSYRLEPFIKESVQIIPYFEKYGILN